MSLISVFSPLFRLSFTILSHMPYTLNFTAPSPSQLQNTETDDVTNEVTHVYRVVKNYR